MSKITSKRPARARKRSAKSNRPSAQNPMETFKAYLDGARSLGLLDRKNTVEVYVHVPRNLLKAARDRANVRSRALLITIALSLVVLHDDFGRQLLRHKGTVDPSIDLEF